MVVISIISLLYSIVFSSLKSARIKARDANRISDLKQIQNALELYYSDYGYYPKRISAHTETASDPCDGTATWCGGTNSLKVDLAPYYKLPTKNGDGFNKSYYYTTKLGNNFQTYGLAASLEGESNLKSNDGGSWSWAYEVGVNPSYCKTKYNSEWWTGYPNVCVGGD